ncbi:MAG: cob(I)yrinic acid a,c-diamide adenosyltransferase [Candidatus Schekmanbacteria bacterium]|nr:cob(I)yrinic acid a,c-diamide adenosyltransferase [Candidatus Schekmanbacteria bacterium]
MKISTGTGDKGTTGLYSGQRIHKFDLRPEAYGTIDEFGSFLGMARSAAKSEKARNISLYIQENLFTVCTELATLPENRGMIKKFITDKEVKQLEAWIDELETELNLPPVFIIPGETFSSSVFHVARTVIRRAERKVTKLSVKEGGVSEELLKFINRLSDLVYLLARLEESLK